MCSYIGTCVIVCMYVLNNNYKGGLVFLNSDEQTLLVLCNCWFQSKLLLMFLSAMSAAEQSHNHCSATVGLGQLVEWKCLFQSMLLILLLFAMSAAEQCNNQCSGGEGDWCGERREENGTVRRCAEQTRWESYGTN